MIFRGLPTGLHSLSPKNHFFVSSFAIPSIEYFNEAERLSSYFYFKCWTKTTVPYDGIFYSENSYPVHKEWVKLFKEPCVVPSDFFHAFYKLTP